VLVARFLWPVHGKASLLSGHLRARSDGEVAPHATPHAFQADSILTVFALGGNDFYEIVDVPQRERLRCLS
jgi:hypothetical protein